jgi:hypothetical protein
MITTKAGPFDPSSNFRMSQSEIHAGAPAPGDRREQHAPEDELAALRDALTEAEDLMADFAIEVLLEAQRVAWEVERLSKEIGDA